MHLKKTSFKDKDKNMADIQLHSSKLEYLYDQALWELRLSYRFIWRDIPAAVLAGVAFTLVAARHHSSSACDCVSAVLWALIYFFHYIYSFNLSNQYTGVEEDKINKPDRPIPSGLVTVEGARFRWYIVTVLYLVVGVAIGNVWSSLLWILGYLAHNHCGLSEHWFTRNSVFLPVGTVVMGWAAWTIVTGSIWMDQESVLFLGMVSFYVGTLANLQDFRDVEGDMKVRRKTMPVQFGMSTSKYFQSFLFIAQFAIFYSVMFSIQPLTSWQVVFMLVDLLVRLYFIVRLLLLDQTPTDFHHTYHSFTKHFIFFISAGLVFL